MSKPTLIPPTIVIPMAGNGQRFRDAGYALPKPLIDVGGLPMIARVMENLSIPGAQFVLIARKADVAENPEAFAKLSAQHACRLVLIDKLTEGAACTMLHAVALINNDTPLLIANSDQLINFPVKDFVADAQARALDGSILTFHEDTRHPKWSYARLDENGFVNETREKQPISDHATVGIYYYGKGRYFVEAAAEMIANNDRCNNEFYVCPAYNYLIRRNLKIGIHKIRKEQMHGLGTPEDLKIYLANTL